MSVSLFLQMLQTRDHKDFRILWFSLWSWVCSTATVEYFIIVLLAKIIYLSRGTTLDDQNRCYRGTPFAQGTPLPDRKMGFPYSTHFWPSNVVTLDERIISSERFMVKYSMVTELETRDYKGNHRFLKSLWSWACSIWRKRDTDILL